MKVIVFLVLLLSIITAERIKIHTTGPPNGRQYNYFPLKTKYLEFNVKSTRDVNVLLCNQFNLDGPYYEIVVGGDMNNISVIKKFQTTNYAARHAGPMIPSNEYQKLWVAMNDTEESISVGKTAGKPFLFLQDPNYVKMSYFGISSGWGAEADWDFDSNLIN